MGFSFRGKHKRDVDAEKHLKRMHKVVPWIESPLQGADLDNLVFAQRHEANAIELFFDLFFVANLATFTTYHSITDHTYLLAYIGFFGILWSCWFQVTLHDVRFARDSVYERICKIIQYIVFVGLALVGSSFNPNGEKGNNTNFRILCYTLVLSRCVLAIQYCVVLFYTFRAHYTRLYLPLGLIIATYGLAAAIFAAMTPAFREKEQSHQGVYLVWYVVMVIETISIIGISSVWRMLSFKKTHLMERMSLLTLIVIGEGAIGVTKTVSRVMGKSGLDVEGCTLVFCVILVLVLLWALYFDNFPHGHYGTIRQQLWSVLHFPFQLAVVGVVEGSQQLALARYVLKNYAKIEDSLWKYCYTENLDGVELRDALFKLVDYWQFDKKLETYFFKDSILEAAEVIGNSTGICAQDVAAKYQSSGQWPDSFYDFTYQMFDGVYIGLGMKLPVDKLEKATALELAIKSWKIVYLYYWGCFCLLIATSITFLILIRRHKADVFDYVSIISRVIALAVGGVLIALISNEDALYNYLGSPGVLPTCLSLLFLIAFFDKMSAAFCNWRLRRSGQPFALEVDEEHGHGGHNDHSHGDVHEHPPNHSHHGSFGEELRHHRKSTTLSTYSDTEPLTGGTEYHGHQSYAMTPLMSPPVASPSLLAHSPGITTATGYMPVSTSQNYGA